MCMSGSMNEHVCDTKNGAFYNTKLPQYLLGPPKQFGLSLSSNPAPGLGEGGPPPQAVIIGGGKGSGGSGMGGGTRGAGPGYSGTDPGK